jgi:hypothetical protein
MATSVICANKPFKKGPLLRPNGYRRRVHNTLCLVHAVAAIRGALGHQMQGLQLVQHHASCVALGAVIPCYTTPPQTQR